MDQLIMELEYLEPLAQAVPEDFCQIQIFVLATERRLTMD